MLAIILLNASDPGPEVVVAPPLVVLAVVDVVVEVGAAVPKGRLRDGGSDPRPILLISFIQIERPVSSVSKKRAEMRARYSRAGKRRSNLTQLIHSLLNLHNS